jgi:ubiquinone/menaquinone biosynthesis C-methylase UbiE
MLQRLCTALRLAPGRTLADLGCGHGGPGLWVVRQTGADLIGIDISPVGVALASEQAIGLGLASRARFEVGDLTGTGLPDASCDAALSLDVLIFVPDQSAAAHEFARILKTGGILGFTSWEQSGYLARLGTEQCSDYRPLLEAAGFTIEKECLAYYTAMNKWGITNAELEDRRREGERSRLLLAIKSMKAEQRSFLAAATSSGHIAEQPAAA